MYNGILNEQKQKSLFLNSYKDRHILSEFSMLYHQYFHFRFIISYGSHTCHV